MKRKIVISFALVVLAIFAFTMVISADECAEHSYGGWTTEIGESGYLGEITASKACTVCQKTTTEKIPQIFVTRGYSYSEDGGITQGYGVNKEALSRYEEITGEKVKFGVFLAVKDVIGDIAPINSNGEAAHEKVKTMEYTDSEHSIFNVSIKGIPQEQQASAGLLCAFYVYAGGVVSYIDNGAQKEECDAKTFDEVKAVPKKDKTEMTTCVIMDGKRYHRLTKVEMNLVQGKFWKDSSLQSDASQAFNNKFWATGNYFTSTTLPVGSVITVDGSNGWQYRPHKWSGTRPGNTKQEVVTVDSSWWGSYTKVGFNIGKYDDSKNPSTSVDPQEDISGYTATEIAEIFAIYIPIEKYNPDLYNKNPIDENEQHPVQPEPENPGQDYSGEKQDWAADGELKILAIGNSFSVDSMEYVYQVAKDAGVEKVTLGNLYIGGCTLATHLSNAKNDSGSYTYYTNTNGTWSSTGGYKISTAVKSDDWDFITFQQASGYSGIENTYDDLVSLINIVEPLNPSARLAWHMTWAYQANSSHSDFSKYDKNQATMYNAIISAVQNKIVTNDKIEVIIPAGTSIQNARTSYIGDTLTRDGYHLSLDLGRYIGSLTYVKSLTGLSIDKSVNVPSGVDAAELLVAIESVNNALATPFAVTTSQYATKPDVSEPEQPTEPDTPVDPEPDTPEDDVIEIPEGYVQLTAAQMGLTESSFYNNTDGKNDITWEATGDAWASGFMATHKFTKETLPVGSVIEIAEGWQYRPEAWAYAGKRPDNVSTYRVVVTEEWWGTYTERAFNISQVTHKTNNIVPITLTPADLAKTVFKIYVPKDVAPEITEPETPDTPTDNTVYVSSKNCVETVTVIDGKEYRALTIEAMGLVKNAYYYSDKAGAVIYSSTDGTSKKFFATGVFTKENLPDGSIVWVNSGWQYRPEGWKHTGSRPGNSTAQITVSDTWWGTYTQRAFNISLTSGSVISGDTYTLEKIYENFKIYIPVENIID